MYFAKWCFIGMILNYIPISNIWEYLFLHCLSKEKVNKLLFSDIISKIKKAEYCRIDAFKLWCWRRVLRVPWTARRSNQSILKEISPEDSLEGLMLKLKLQYFGHLMRRTDSREKTLMLGKIEGKRRRGWQTMRWLDGISKSMMPFNHLILSPSPLAFNLSQHYGLCKWVSASHQVPKVLQIQLQHQSFQ